MKVFKRKTNAGWEAKLQKFVNGKWVDRIICRYAFDMLELGNIVREEDGFCKQRIILNTQWLNMPGRDFLIEAIKNFAKDFED